MIYLDNGATTFPKPKGMIEAMERCMSDKPVFPRLLSIYVLTD